MENSKVSAGDKVSKGTSSRETRTGAAFSLKYKRTRSFKCQLDYLEEEAQSPFRSLRVPFPDAFLSNRALDG